MHTPCRPTKRCLVDDLRDDWDDAGHRVVATGDDVLERCTVPLTDLEHPAIQKATSDFPAEVGDAQVNRESISGLSDPMWWKLKVARWRGAIYVDDSGQAWLCAAGYREAGSRNDFYKAFMREVEARGAAYFLPTVDDLARAERETRGARFAAWEAEIVRSARAAAAAAAQHLGVAQPFEIVHPRGRRLASVTVEASVVEDLVELIVQIGFDGWENQDISEFVQNVVVSSIRSEEQEWQTFPIGGVPTYSTIFESIDPTVLAEKLRNLRSPAGFIPGSVAHRSHRQRLTQSSVDGEGVQALCGTWFVPRQDHESLAECSDCAAIHRLMPK